jgi:hypothetical protein
MLRNGLVGAALAVLALGSAAMADTAVSAPADSGAGIKSNVPVDLARVAVDPVIYGDDQATSAPAAPVAAAAPEAAAAPDTAIMWGLDQVGAGKVMKDLNLSITGYIELGYFYDLTAPKDTQPDRGVPPNDGIFFPGDYKNSIMLNQVDLAIQRTVDTSKFDVGFMVEGIFGRDAVFTHSNGILDNRNKHGDTSPDNDLDLEQAYLTFAIPLGSGITITAGKFDTLMGYETINPTTNALYTHSYLFSYSVPLTQTGITGAYNITDSLAVTAGITRGWNQSTSDNNGAIDFLGQVVWKPTNKLSVTVNFSEGPQNTGDCADYSTVPEAIISYQVADQLKVAADLVYGTASHYAQWYGVAGYVTYTPCKYAAINFRSEFYHDGHVDGFNSSGVFTGAAYTTGLPSMTDLDFFEETLGVALTPAPDVNLLQSLTIRPEIRLDIANHGVFDNTSPVPGGFNGHFTQLTMALDAYWKF